MVTVEEGIWEIWQYYGLVSLFFSSHSLTPAADLGIHTLPNQIKTNRCKMTHKMIYKYIYR